MDYYKIPYRVVEVSPLTKRQLKWGDHRKVPVLGAGVLFRVLRKENSSDGRSSLILVSVPTVSSAGRLPGGGVRLPQPLTPETTPA